MEFGIDLSYRNDFDVSVFFGLTCILSDRTNTDKRERNKKKCDKIRLESTFTEIFRVQMIKTILFPT